MLQPFARSSSRLLLYQISHVRRVGRRSHTGGEQEGVVESQESWKQVIDKQTGLPYWWNPQTGQTTAVGEAKPSGAYNPYTYNYEQVGFFGNFVRLAALGFGFGAMAIMLRMLLTGGFRQ
eukprot:TRINITY_DN1647_c0_g1_i2.p5 TRINITY_DN1647_c0_g1~~TRINITY_DN1647_c0_g1_i2.p5  ORF type:complete len:120 (+),score=23.00 TRINITY_DN1647_c0_g1_i2:284-643(+)